MREDETEGAPDLDEASDALAIAALEGDRDAAERLFRLAEHRVKAVAVARGVPVSEIEDVANDVLRRLWEKLHTFDARRGSFLAWLHQSARNAISNHFRDTRHQRAQESLDASGAEAPPSALRSTPHRAVESRLYVVQTLACLSAAQREAFVLYYFGGMRSREIGGLLGLSDSRVRHMLRDARKRVEMEMADTSGDPVHG